MNFIKKISYLLFAVLMLTIGTNGVEAQRSTPGDCSISDIYLEPQTGLTGTTEITLTLEQGHADCASDETEFTLMITEEDSGPDDDIYDEVHQFHKNGEPFKLTFVPNNDECESGTNGCRYYVEIEVRNEPGISVSNTGVRNDITYNSDFDEDYTTTWFFSTPEKLKKAQLVIPCTGSCVNGDIEIISTENDYSDDSQTCKATSVEFTPYGKKIDPNFLKSGQQQVLELKFVTENCVSDENSKRIKIEILTKSGSATNANEVAESADVTGNISSDGLVKVTYIPGDEDCDEVLDGKDYCNYGVKITESYNTPSSRVIYESPNGSVEGTKSKIGFYCNGECDDEEWNVVNTNLEKNNLYDPEVVSMENDFDVTDPCYVPDLDGNPANKPNPGYKPGCYEPLVVLPGAGDNVYQTDEGTNRQYIDFETFQLGDYVNFLFKIALGVLMVLAVIMIIIAGVQYMTEESIYGKSNARSRITNAVTGLLVALGIFTVLSTINPRLLDVNFTPPSVYIEYQKNQNIEGESIEEIGDAYKGAEGISTGLKEIEESLAKGVKIAKISISGEEGATRGVAIIELENGEKSSSFPVGFGLNGITDNWQSGNKNTPTGSFTLGKNRYDYSTDGEAVLTYDKKYNMGPAFISIDQSPYVGVGIHGKAQANSLSSTYGCIRVRNEDLLIIMKNIDVGSSKIEIKTT